MKRCSTSSVTKEMQIKTTIKMTMIKNKRRKHQVRMKNRTLIHHWGWNVKLLCLLWKSVWWLLNKVNTDLPYNSAISLLGIHPKEMKTRIQTNTLHKCHSIIPNSQKVETTQMPTNWWMSKQNGNIQLGMMDRRHTATCMDLKTLERPVNTSHSSYDSIYRKYPAQVNPETK